MDGLRDYCTKRNKSNRERQMLYNKIYLWYLKYELTYKTETDSDIENRFVVDKRKGKGEGWMGWELEISRCKLLHIERVNIQVLLYNIGNYIP